MPHEENCWNMWMSANLRLTKHEYYTAQVLGRRVNYVLQVPLSNEEMQRYKAWLIATRAV